MGSRWQPVVDGTFVADFPSKLTAASKFTKVPMIIGMSTWNDGSPLADASFQDLQLMN